MQQAIRDKMRFWSFRKYFSKLAVLLLVGHSLLFSGCDFFGKKEEDTDKRAPSELAFGISIGGAFTSILASPSTDKTPMQAIGVTYNFEPNGNSKIEVEDYNALVKACTGHGQYRVVGANDVFIYTQAISGSCMLPSPFHMLQVQKKTSLIMYKEENSDRNFYLWEARFANAVAPVGVWNFQGQGGIEYLLFDRYGYFIMEVKQNEERILLPGLYNIVSGRVELQFFANMDPSQLVDAPIVFNRYITDGKILQLIQTSEQGEDVYQGVRN